MAVLLPSERANFSASGAAPSLNLPLKKDSHCFPALKLPLFVRGRSFSSVARAPRVLLTGLDWARSRAEGHSLYRYTCPMDWFLTPEIFLSLFSLSLSLLPFDLFESPAAHSALPIGCRPCSGYLRRPPTGRDGEGERASAGHSGFRWWGPPGK